MALAAKETFLQVCDELTWMRELTFAMQIINGNDLLQSVIKTPAGAQSITNAIANVAMTGTTLNPILKKAFLVPRSVKGVMMCCLDFSYQGLCGIAMDSGSVKHISASLVYTFDKFDYQVVDGDIKFTHRPSLCPDEEFLKAPAEKFWDFVLCGYCVATLHDGTKQIFSPFLKWKMKKGMETSKTSGAGTPWRTHPDEMCLKTILKHEYKYLPQTDRMSQAVGILNEFEGIETTTDRKAQARQAAESIFSTAEDATFTDAGKGPGNIKDWNSTAGANAHNNGGVSAQPAAAGRQSNEPTMEPVITPDQCAEIDQRIKDVGYDYDQFLGFLGVKNISDIPASSYGTAIAALEAKRKQNDAAAGRKASGDTAGNLQNGQFQPQSVNEILTVLSVKGLTAETDDAGGSVQVKLAFGDNEKRDFVKGLGFKWDATNKVWTWKAA
jgi:recombination protein RecT